MKPDQVIIGLLLFSLFVIAGVTITTNMASDYDVALNSSIFDGAENESEDTIYAPVREISNITSRISTQISSQEGVSGDSAVGAVLSGIWGVLLLIPASFSLVSGILQGIGGALNIPPIITTILFMIFVVGILFMIVYLISKATNTV